MRGLLEAGSVDPRAVEADAAAAGAQGLTTILAPMDTWVTWVMAALVGAALIALLGIALQRGTLNMHYTRQDLGSLRDSLVVEIARLDDLHAMGEISDSEWLQHRSQLKAQLMDVIRRLNRGRAREA